MRHRWHSDHRALRRIYDARIGDRMSQREFAKQVGISQAMLALLLGGDRPLPIDVAKGLARELHCTIEDICPDMAAYLRDEVVPVLGKALRRAAMVLLAIGSFQLAPSDAYARAVYHNATEKAPFFAKCVNILHIVALWIRCRARRIIAGCALTHLFHEHRTAR